MVEDEDDDPTVRLLRDAEGCDVHGNNLRTGTLPLLRQGEGIDEMTNLPIKVLRTKAMSLSQRITHNN